MRERSKRDCFGEEAREVALALNQMDCDSTRWVGETSPRVHSVDIVVVVVVVAAAAAAAATEDIVADRTMWSWENCWWALNSPTDWPPTTVDCVATKCCCTFASSSDVVNSAMNGAATWCGFVA